MPLNAAASKLEPKSQSPQMPTLACASNMQGTPGVFTGSAAPLTKVNPTFHQYDHSWVL